VTSRVDQTWIDGRLYFDRERDLQARKAWEEERQRLIELVRSESESEPDAEAESQTPEDASAPEDAEGAPADSEVEDSDPDPGLTVLRRLLGGARS